MPGEDDSDDADQFDETLAALGLRLEDSEPDGDADAENGDGMEPCYLWPCNVKTFYLWHRLQTQWNVGTADRTGLDYASVIAVLRDVVGIKKKELQETFRCLQAMEMACLKVWSESRAS